MTTINQTTMLVAAITALVSSVSELKKAGHETIGLGTEIIDGVKYRDLKNWLKDFKAKQKEVTPPAPKTETKPAAKTPVATSSSSSDDVRDLELSNSSNIESAVYNRTNKVLRITFKNGSVYDYAGVGIREANNFEKAESAGKFFAEFIKGKKDTTKIKAAAPRNTVKETAPAPKATAPKAASAKETAPAVEYKAAELRGATLMNGRKAETIVKVVASKDGEGRDVITDSKARYNVSSLRKNNRGKFVVEAAAPAPKATPKAAPAQTVKEPKGNRRANFDLETANNVRKSKPLPPLPKVSDVKGAEVRIIKGSKDKMVKVIRVVSREGQRMAITENRFAIPFGQIIFNDDVLTYTGKLTAEEFRAA